MRVVSYCVRGGERNGGGSGSDMIIIPSSVQDLLVMERRSKRVKVGETER
jgi:hypothetical protein